MNTTTKKTNTKSTVVEETKEVNTEQTDLTQRIKELEAQIQSLLNMQKASIETPKSISIDNKENTDEQLEEPNANKQIKVISMFFGSLNLCNNKNRSAGKVITFDRFGQVKSILYHDLVDFVNNERKFAEEGYFYILDKNAVYHLGLSENYTKLIDSNIMKNILSYGISDIEAIVANMTPVQQNTLVQYLASKIYNDESVDMNKIELINKITGQNINNIVQEQKEMASAMIHNSN